MMAPLKLTSWHDFPILLPLIAATAAICVYKMVLESRRSPKGYSFIPQPDTAFWLVGLSLFASINSSIQMASIPVLVYKYGIVYLWESIALLLSVWLCTGIYNFFYRIDIVSINQYVFGRFGRNTMNYSIIMSLIFLLFFIPLWAGVSAEASHSASGISPYITIPILYVTAGLVAVQGGLRTLVYVEAFRVIVDVATFTSIIISSGTSGGYSIHDIQNFTHRLEFLKYETPLQTKHSTLTVTFGTVAQSLAFLSTCNIGLQKVFMCSSPSHVKWALLIILVLAGVFLTLYVVIGLYMVVRFMHCDPLATGEATTTTFLSMYVTEIEKGMQSPLHGFFIYSIFFSGWTNVISGFNALALAIYVDMLNGRGIFIARNRNMVSVAIYIYAFMGILLTLSPWVVENKCLWGRIIMSLTLCPVFAICLLGLLVPNANSQGVMTGAVASNLLMVSLMTMGLVRPVDVPVEPLPNDGCSNASMSVLTDSYRKYETPFAMHVSTEWYPVLSVLIVLIVGYLISWLWNYIYWRESMQRDVHLYMNVYEDLFPFTLFKSYSRKRKSRSSEASIQLGGNVWGQATSDLTRMSFVGIRTSMASSPYTGATLMKPVSEMRTSEDLPYTKSMRTQSYESDGSQTPVDR